MNPNDILELTDDTNVDDSLPCSPAVCKVELGSVGSSIDDDSNETNEPANENGTLLPQLEPLSIEAFYDQVRLLTWRLPNHINVTWRRDGSILIPPRNCNWCAPPDNTSEGVNYAEPSSPNTTRRHHHKKGCRKYKKVVYYYK
ncbi:hypothetical protein WA158_002982 [Blastocystis sp. Blastoise]